MDKKGWKFFFSQLPDLIETFVIAILFIGAFGLLVYTYNNPAKNVDDSNEPHSNIECQKPCCHLMFNRFCDDCKDYRRNH